MRQDTTPQHLSYQRVLFPTTQVNNRHASKYSNPAQYLHCCSTGRLIWNAKDQFLSFSEVAAAVEAQLRFAAEEEAAAASINEVYVLPEDNGLAGYGTEDDLLLAGYGEQDEALDAYTTSYGRF